MDCAIGDIDVQQDDGTMRGVEIIPEGCQPVSDDRCSSGYMAPSDNVSFPLDSLEQCCKCKEGESCKLCEIPEDCTDEEKEEFVTNDNCFEAGVGPSPGPSTGPSPDPSEEEENGYLLYIGICCSCILLIMVLFLSLSR
jgi:hypothetical protein